MDPLTPGNSQSVDSAGNLSMLELLNLLKYRRPVSAGAERDIAFLGRVNHQRLAAHKYPLRRRSADGQQQVSGSVHLRETSETP